MPPSPRGTGSTSDADRIKHNRKKLGSPLKRTRHYAGSPVEHTLGKRPLPWYVINVLVFTRSEPALIYYEWHGEGRRPDGDGSATIAIAKVGKEKKGLNAMRKPDMLQLCRRFRRSQDDAKIKSRQEIEHA